MERILMILEVSRKQDYIFGSHKLKENASRSADINYVTNNTFFEEVAGEFYKKEENFVYAGGGHTILQFATREQAVAFAGKVTEEAMRQFEGLEMFVKLNKYNFEASPGENLKDLSKELEKKKSQRENSFRQTSLGMEELDSQNYRPILLEKNKNSRNSKVEKLELKAPSGWEFPTQFEELRFKTKKDDNFIAVIHIDGNSMGSRVDAIYQKYQGKEDWEKCCESLRNFSKGIQEDFEAAFNEMVEVVMQQELEDNILPVRPVILAGDDVCFVSSGVIGLECARIFLEKLSKKKNKEDQTYYSACAGVALVHRKYPFHLAYDLAEELCSSAKKFGVQLDDKSRISAMDWHIEFGQLKDGISEIRREYETEDGNRLELRPVIVINPQEMNTDPIRDYRFFKTMCYNLQQKQDNIARSKVKEWRTALKQGEKETEFFLHNKQIKHILGKGFDALYRSDEEKAEQYIKILKYGEKMIKEPFREYNGEKHCIFFDPIEMMDHAVFFEEVKS